MSLTHLIRTTAIYLLLRYVLHCLFAYVSLWLYCYMRFAIDLFIPSTHLIICSVHHFLLSYTTSAGLEPLHIQYRRYRLGMGTPDARSWIRSMTDLRPLPTAALNDLLTVPKEHPI
jgi:hypothetical protein